MPLEGARSEERALRSLASARYTICPLTIVATIFPVNCQPSNGVFCTSIGLWRPHKSIVSWDRISSHRHGCLGKRARPGKSTTRTGPAVNNSTILAREILCSRCSRVMANQARFLALVIPNAACSNSLSFMHRMRSMIGRNRVIAPSANATRTASRSADDRSGGSHF